MLQLDGQRDLRRELSRLDGFPAEVSAALALAKACGIDLAPGPMAAWPAVVDIAQRHSWPVPRVSLAQLDDAVRAPILLAHVG